MLQRMCPPVETPGLRAWPLDGSWRRRAEREAELITNMLIFRGKGFFFFFPHVQDAETPQGNSAAIYSRARRTIPRPDRLLEWRQSCERPPWITFLGGCGFELWSFTRRFCRLPFGSCELFCINWLHRPKLSTAVHIWRTRYCSPHTLI